MFQVKVLINNMVINTAVESKPGYTISVYLKIRYLMLQAFALDVMIFRQTNKPKN